MSELPAAQERHRHQHHQAERRQNDRADDLRLAREVLEKLVQKQEVPLGTGCRKLLGGISGRPQRGTLFTHHKKEHHHKHGETRHRIAQDLLRPEALIGSLERLLGGQPVLPEQIHMPHDQHDDGTRYDSGVQREEPRERVVSVVHAAHDHRLQRLPNARAHAHDVRGHGGRPVAVLIPRQQVAGK